MSRSPDEDRLFAAAAAVPAPCLDAIERAHQRQNQLTKPTGALGRLEELAVQVAGITGTDRPPRSRKLAVVFAADHGVVSEGVSAYPSEVTAQMVRSFVSGTAAVSVLARTLGVQLVVVDVGVASPLPLDLPIEHRKIRPGTASMVTGPAMSRAEAVSALCAGMDVIEARLQDGIDLLALGEMGIGNTTSAAALGAVFLALGSDEMVGPGTGVDETGMARKRSAVRRGLATNAPKAADPIGVLAAVGGLEIAALAGAMIRAGAERLPIVLDGFITGVAALAAVRIAPQLTSYLIAAHRSPEPGHGPVLSALGLRPLLDLGIRLGEASGAMLGLSIVDAALATHAEMATFDAAGVANRIEISAATSIGPIAD